jgi:hypothetical protein
MYNVSDNYTSHFQVKRTVINLGALKSDGTARRNSFIQPSSQTVQQEGTALFSLQVRRYSKKEQLYSAFKSDGTARRNSFIQPSSPTVQQEGTVFLSAPVNKCPNICFKTQIFWVVSYCQLVTSQ